MTEHARHGRHGPWATSARDGAWLIRATLPPAHRRRVDWTLLTRYGALVALALLILFNLAVTPNFASLADAQRQPHAGLRPSSSSASA